MLGIALYAITLATSHPTATAPQSKQVTPPPRYAMMCMLTGEQSSGMTKICYYDCLGSPAAITVSATSLCPLSINR